MDHAPQSVCANDDAEKKIPNMSVTLDTSHLEMSPLNDDAEWNMVRMSVTLDTSHLEMSPLNDDAERNKLSMLATLDTSHIERSLLNEDAEENIPHILVTLDTSHVERSPVNLFDPKKLINAPRLQHPLIVSALSSQWSRLMEKLISIDCINHLNGTLELFFHIFQHTGVSFFWETPT